MIGQLCMLSLVDLLTSQFQLEFKSTELEIQFLCLKVLTLNFEPKISWLHLIFFQLGTVRQDITVVCEQLPVIFF